MRRHELILLTLLSSMLIVIGCKEPSERYEIEGHFEGTRKDPVEVKVGVPHEGICGGGPYDIRGFSFYKFTAINTGYHTIGLSNSGVSLYLYFDPYWRGKYLRLGPGIYNLAGGDTCYMEVWSSDYGSSDYDRSFTLLISFP